MAKLNLDVAVFLDQNGVHRLEDTYCHFPLAGFTVGPEDGPRQVLTGFPSPMPPK